MHFLGRISIVAAAVLSAAYSVYAITQYRRAWDLCRSRLNVPCAVQLFYAYLLRNDFIRNPSHLSFLHTGEESIPEVMTSDSAAAREKSETAEVVAQPLANLTVPTEASAAEGPTNTGVAETMRASGGSTLSVQLARCPVAFVDNAAFEANVRSAGLALLAGRKQIRLSTIDIRCPQLLERAAVLLERLAIPGAEYDTITSEMPFVAGLCTSTASETLWWANRGSFASLLLGTPLMGAVDAEIYLEAMTLHAASSTTVAGHDRVKGGGAGMVHCSVVVNAVRQLELLWEAAKAWIRDHKYERLGFDHAVESLQINVVVLVDPSPQPVNLLDFLQRFNAGQGGIYEKKTGDTSPYAFHTEEEILDFFAEVEKFNAKIKTEELPVGVQFVIEGISFMEGNHVAYADVGPVATGGITCCIPARWFILYPLLQWYKKRAEQYVAARRRSILHWLAHEKRVIPRGFIITGGSSTSLVTSANDDTLTEVRVGVGLLCDQTLDRYVDSIFTPALYFALTTTRVVVSNLQRVFLCTGFGDSLSSSSAVYPVPLKTLHGGLRGYMDPGVGIAVASAWCGNTSDVPNVDIGVPVVFRPQCNSALAELVDVYLLVTEGGSAVEVLPTYRGEGWNIWAAQLRHVRV